MQFHSFRAKHPGRRARRIGRGGKRGTYSGRGMKGQKSRAGARIRPAIRDYIKSIPKLRGEEFPAVPAHTRSHIVQLGQLRKHFSQGAVISPKTLAAAGLVSSPKTPVKLLSDGDAPAKLTVRGIAVSKGAREKITRGGGKIEDHV